jgi:hypothetical protein
MNHLHGFLKHIKAGLCREEEETGEKNKKLYSLYTVIFKCLDAEQNRRRRSEHAGLPNVHKKSKNDGEVSTFRAFNSVDTPSKKFNAK